MATLLASAAMAQAQSAGASLEVVVPQLRNAQGGLGCQLFAGANGFPMKSDQALQTVSSPITNGTARCRFQQVPPGTYAVAVVHDENGNQKLDSNMLGVPTGRLWRVEQQDLRVVPAALGRVALRPRRGRVPATDDPVALLNQPPNHQR
ncbi:MAG: DUF2141 domain-containing protein [Hydrogenophaga sp.]|nr:DUF2141 domain-containing protein [Hydrogenophaga sp.]